jgi:hypothetical protein
MNSESIINKLVEYFNVENDKERESLYESIKLVFDKLYELGYEIIPSNIEFNQSELDVINNIIRQYTDVYLDKINEIPNFNGKVEDYVGIETIYVDSILHELKQRGWKICPPNN